ncbi:hypothetical protein HN51_061070 [Arachis hypogaea]|uniref:cytosolic sulfotransferase 5 n=1 Tax=Arachis hypogaea TaxID=3818 RepID=UPI0007AFDB7D|nr:cytosolic sulfotransferase 5 isoform X1 [Arachis ipaensis]QHO18250.1 Cytosolic sulfotransferase [Arachis hypogaea]
MAEDQPSLLHKFVQDELPQELRDLVSTMPMENGWTEKHLYQYQGFWYNPFLLQALVTLQKHFHANDNDIFLVSIPKSGTTWLKALAFSLVNRSKYPNYQNHPLINNSPHALVPFFELDLNSNNEFLPNLNLSSSSSSLFSSSPRIISTHFSYVSLPNSVKESSCKIVYLCRDPKDILISHWHFANKVRKGIIDNLSLEEAFEMFCKGVSASGPFWDHMLGYWNQGMKSLNKKKIMFIKYEEIKMNPLLVLKELAEFLGFPFSREEEALGVVEDILKLCSFDNLSNLEVNTNGKMPFGVENNVFFRRGQVGDWKNYLTTEMVEKLNNIIANKLTEHGIQF